MSTRRLLAYTVERSDEALRAVYVVSPTTRAQSKDNWHRIRVGITREGRDDWLGEWDQRNTSLTKGVRYDITGDADLNFVMEPGSEVVVEVLAGGSPASLDGMKVSGKGHRVGEVGDTESPRTDGGTYPGSRALISHVFTGVGQDPGTERIATALNDSGVLEFTFDLPLTDQVVASSVSVTGLHKLVEEYLVEEEEAFQNPGSTAWVTATGTGITKTFSNLDDGKTYCLEVWHRLQVQALSNGTYRHKMEQNVSGSYADFTNSEEGHGVTVVGDLSGSSCFSTHPSITGVTSFSIRMAIKEATGNWQTRFQGYHARLHEVLE